MSKKKSHRKIHRIAVNTGGGDAPGLNAVIRSVVLSAEKLGWEVYGITEGYNGLTDGKGIKHLRHKDVEGITSMGGTILGTTNKGNPFKQQTMVRGKIVTKDISGQIVKNFHKHHLDALIAIGGDGSIKIGYDLSKKGIPVVAIPKTIDNDVPETLASFGFDTAVAIATDAIDRLHSTAMAHDRVMVVEVMGAHSGYIALFAGVAGAADVILMPEIPFRLDLVGEKIKSKYKGKDGYAIVVVAEGAKPKGAKAELTMEKTDGQRRLGGIGEFVESQIYQMTGKETRSLVLGHLQRGGSPSARDRLLALRFGAAAVRAVEKGRTNTMVAYQPPHIVEVPLELVAGRTKTVPLDGDLVATARNLGICLGDE